MLRSLSLDSLLVRLKSFLTTHPISPKKEPNPVKESIREDFLTNYCKNSQVVKLPITVGERTMHAFRLDPAAAKKADPERKKVIIHLMDAQQYAALSLPEIEVLLLKLCSAETRVAAYCMDYRGRGFNSECQQEKFSNYTFDRDVEDQSLLIKYILNQGYKPEDIILYGEGYGERLALWILYELSLKNPDIATMKVFTKTAYGSLNDPSFMTQLQNYTPPVSITNVPDDLVFEKISGLHEHHFLQALVSDKPITIYYPVDAIDVAGYALKAGAKPGDDSFISLNITKSTAPEHYNLQSDAVNALLKRLHCYCVERANDAASSKYGPNYKRNSILTSFWGLPAIDLVSKAVQIMKCLGGRVPNWNEIVTIANSAGPHNRGVQKTIFSEVLALAVENLKLKEFNDTILRLAKPIPSSPQKSVTCRR